MSRILLVGYNPPIFEGDAKIEAAHYRTWQFLEPLLDDNHTVCLCVDNPATSTDIQSLIPDKWAELLEYQAIPFRKQTGWVKQLQQIHNTFQPDCIVAVNFDCCLFVTKLKTDKPIWMDIYGDYLTILQVARYRQGSDRGIGTSISFMRRVLQKGDLFSGCGTPQQHILVGELAMAGRLNSRTFGYQFSQVVLPGSPPKSDYSEHIQEETLLGKQTIPDNSFVVLWCGGYNTWTDIETLFAGLEWAMAHDNRIHYLSVGANTYEAPDNVYSRFLDLIAQSKYKDRYHMLGWRPWTEIAGYYRQSNVGINIDAIHYETIYGTRTRLVEMLAAGLPVITSLGCELANLIENHGAGLTFNSGNWQNMGQQIVTLAKDNNLYTTMVDKALHYATNKLSFYATTTPVRTWVKAPKQAPDNIPANAIPGLKKLEYKARSILRQVIWSVLGVDK